MTIEKCYIWTCSSSIAPKLGRVVTQVKWPAPTKSHYHVASRKTENLTSTLSQNLWQPNFAEWWLRGGGDLVPPPLLLQFWMLICNIIHIIYNTVFLIILAELLLRRIIFHSHIYLLCYKKRNTKWACDKMWASPKCYIFRLLIMWNISCIEHFYLCGEKKGEGFQGCTIHPTPTTLSF